MNPAILAMLGRYQCVSARDYKNALKEVIQEIALLGLWRAKFFEHAAFYGGTALRILYGLDRFSQDIDFSLLKPQKSFTLQPYLKAVMTELASMGFTVDIEAGTRSTAIDSAFIKAGTKEHLLKIKTPGQIADKIHKDSLLTIKFEVDTDPPGGFQTQAKTLLQPIPFAVNAYQQPDLFAGKLHAVLQRKWKNRVKGRDYYDLVWYVAREIPVRLEHLEQRLRQSGAWGTEKLQLTDLLGLLREKFAALDVAAAKNDVSPFLKDPSAIELWSKDFFESLLPKLKSV
ncbi:MAG: nucleotidyl transferase AbiEii/AbiGii toxin family protein [Elusimicrobiota bacterium]